MHRTTRCAPAAGGSLVADLIPVSGLLPAVVASEPHRYGVRRRGRGGRSVTRPWAALAFVLVFFGLFFLIRRAGSLAENATCARHYGTGRQGASRVRGGP